MTTSERASDRRVTERLDRALQIILPGLRGETVNISSTGVYFVVITSNIEAFSPGTTIPIQIKTSAATPGFKARDINLTGSGSVVRNDIKGVTSHGDRLGVALKFDDKLDIQFDSIQRLM